MKAVGRQPPTNPCRKKNTRQAKSSSFDSPLNKSGLCTTGGSPFRVNSYGTLSRNVIGFVETEGSKSRPFGLGAVPPLGLVCGERSIRRVEEPTAPNTYMHWTVIGRTFFPARRIWSERSSTRRRDIGRDLLFRRSHFLGEVERIQNVRSLGRRGAFRPDQ